MASPQTRADYYLIRHDYRNAYREYKSVLDRGKRNSGAHLGMGITLMGMGRLNLAYRHFESAERYGGRINPEIWSRFNALRKRRSLRMRRPSGKLSFEGGQVGKSNRKKGKARKKRKPTKGGISQLGGNVGRSANTANYAKVPSGGYLHSAPSRGSIRLIG